MGDRSQGRKEHCGALVRLARARLYILGLSRKVGRAELGCGGGAKPPSRGRPSASRQSSAPSLGVGERSANRLRLDPVWPERTRRFRSLRKPCTPLSQSSGACAPQWPVALRTRPLKQQPGPTRDSGMASGSVSRPTPRRQRRLDRRD